MTRNCSNLTKKCYEKTIFFGLSTELSIPKTNTASKYRHKCITQVIELWKWKAYHATYCRFITFEQRSQRKNLSN